MLFCSEQFLFLLHFCTCFFLLNRVNDKGEEISIVVKVKFYY